MNTCCKCNEEYDIVTRRGMPGKVTECNDCAEEVAVKYTGNVIYDHKTSASIQINTNPELTRYINGATKLMNKGSNLGNNLKVPSKMAHSKGACLYTADRVQYKSR